MKLHIGVDVLGLPHALLVTTADVSDRDGAVKMVKFYDKSTYNLYIVEKLLCDGGYSGENFANEIKAAINADVEIVKRNELHNFVVLPKRWIVERTFGWANHSRRLSKDYEISTSSAENNFYISHAHTLLRRIC